MMLTCHIRSIIMVTRTVVIIMTPSSAMPYALPISFMLPNTVTNARQETSKNQFITGMYI
uniref:Uncharacterized protein n=1 Tax=Arundo donax TaxID=35708 RepID=A0A0A9DHM0_ARUDO